MRLTVKWEREEQCDQLLHGRERLSATNCYMGGRGDSATNCYMGGECGQLLHGRERYSVTNCYMGGRGTVRPTVTWEGEVKFD